MQFDLPNLLASAWASIQNPRQGARAVMALRPTAAQGAQALLAVALLSALMSFLVVRLSQMLGEDLGPMAAMVPIDWAIAQVAGLFVLAWAIHLVGRLFGGTGRSGDAMALMAWGQAIMLGLQIVQLAVLLALPALSLPLGLAVLGINLWLLVNFTTELHGFTSPGKVFAGMIGAGMALMVLATLLLTAILGLSGF